MQTVGSVSDASSNECRAVALMEPCLMLSGLNTLFAGFGVRLQPSADIRSVDVSEYDLVVCFDELYLTHRELLADVPVLVLASTLSPKVPGAVSPAASMADVAATVADLLGVGLPAAPKLSPREREMLALAAQGLSTEEIAQHCFVGAATVKTHMLRAFRKLDVPDRASAVYRAVQSGLIP